MPTYRTPDVCIEEISVFPPSVAEVESAVPAFIGYTQRARRPEPSNESLTPKPTKVYSFPEFERLFGKPEAPTIAIALTASDPGRYGAAVTAPTTAYLLYWAVKMYFDNGGGKCVVVTAGPYADPAAVALADLRAGLDAVALEDEPTLLGRRCGREVMRIDLSLMVSKYIGETEKNLGRVFDAAERHGWILFFDEADALFGKRTRVADAHDRYANHEFSYLRQRVEDFSGVAILASNLRQNIDEAFARRFQAVVAFMLPSAAERERLWREAFPACVRLEPRLDLARLAECHELSGGTILNVVRHACLRAAARGGHEIHADDVDDGVLREGLKEGRAL